MAQRLPQDHHWPEWLRRLDRAAGRMNPFLTLVVIGLVMLNLACLALLLPGVPVTRRPLADQTACPVAAPVNSPGASERPTADTRAWTVY